MGGCIVFRSNRQLDITASESAPQRLVIARVVKVGNNLFEIRTVCTNLVLMRVGIAVIFVGGNIEVGCMPNLLRCRIITETERVVVVINIVGIPPRTDNCILSA